MANSLFRLEAIFVCMRPFAVVALRWIIGGVFLFSGFSKGIDLWGVIYKVDDYLKAFSLDWALPYAGFVSVVLTTLEFVVGALLLIGSFRRATVVISLAIMAFMLPLTAYVALYNPVPDCGCFGEVWVISNTATFWKNVAITICLVFLMRKNATVRSMYGPAVQWLTVVFPAVFLWIVMAVGYYEQPLLDFRPYKEGTYVTGESVQNVEYWLIYEKNGERQSFSLDSLPDTTWTFVDREEVKKDVASTGRVVNRIAFFDGDFDMTDDVLSSNRDMMLLLISDLSDVNVASTFAINELYRFLSDSGVAMICLTSGSDEEIDEWRDISMAEYPVYKMDDTMLKTIARGNPALVRVDDGKILWKTALDYVVSDELLSREGMSDDNVRLLVVLSAALILVMLALLAVNRTPLLIKFTMRLKKNRKKK